MRTSGQFFPAGSRASVIKYANFEKKNTLRFRKNDVIWEITPCPTPFSECKSKSQSPFAQENDVQNEHSMLETS